MKRTKYINKVTGMVFIYIGEDKDGVILKPNSGINFHVDKKHFSDSKFWKKIKG